MIYISGDLFLDIAGGITPNLRYPRIGYNNLIESASSVSTISGYSASSVLNNYTYERWKTEIGTLQLDLGSVQDVDYVAIGAHTCAGVNIGVQYSVDGVSWTLLKDFVASTNNAIMILFDETEMRYIKIEVADVAEIGIVYAGKVLVMERKIYGGHSPDTLSRDTEKNIYLSEEGEYLGARIVRKGFSADYSFSNLTASWVRSDFDPFIIHARTEPYFIAWRPLTFPSEVIFGWTDKDIRPSNQGLRDYMSVSFSVKGYDEL